MKILYATQNAAKVHNMRRRLTGTNIELLTPADLGVFIEVEENGGSVGENAMKKALAYAPLVSVPVLAADSGLLIDGLPDSEQPGMFVRRVNGVLLTDDEMIDHYAALAARLGGQRRAHYITGLAMVVCGRRFCREVPETEFILTSRPNPDRSHTGNPLDAVAIDPVTGKYHNKLSDSDFKASRWHFERACLDFVLSSLQSADIQQ